MAHELYYRQAHGRYSKLIAPIGLMIPPRLAEAYEIRVTEAGPDSLRVVAQSDRLARAPDRVTIDEEFNLMANFQLPEPRPAYLRFVALKTLRALQAGAPLGQDLEKTAFKSFFRYERRMDSRQRVVATALGVQEPVLGQKLEVGPDGLAAGSEWAILNDAFGAAFEQEPAGSTEAFNRKVFQGELGRSPDSPEELALFEGIEPQPTGLVTRDAVGEPEVEALDTPLEAERAPASAVATVSNTAKTQGNFHARGLEIESIPEDN